MIKNIKKIFFKKSLNGYMIAMATVMLSIILILSMSISFIFLREIKRGNIPNDSIIAYNYADTVLRCLESVQSVSIETNNLENNGIFTADGRGVLDFSSTTLDINKAQEAICFSNNIFPKVSQDINSGFANINIIPHGDDKYPRQYWGGYYIKNVFGFSSQLSQYQDSYYNSSSDKDIVIFQNPNIIGSDYLSCVYFEVYASTTNTGIPKRLYIVRGKTPCDGGVQRIITKTY